MMGFYQIFLANLKIFYRNRAGFFWTVVMPAIIFTALCLLPVQKIAGDVGVRYPTFLLPGILAMAIMQGGIYSLAYRLVDFKARGVLKRFTVTPITKFQFAAGTMAALLAVMYIQAIILTLIGVFIFGSHVELNMLNIFSSVIFIFLGGTVFLLLGLIISTFADTYEAAAPITAAVGLPLTFLGNIFYPVGILPTGLKTLAQLLPITYFAEGLRNAFLQPFHAGVFGLQAAVLIGWIIFATCIVAWRFKLEA